MGLRSAAVLVGGLFLAGGCDRNETPPPAATGSASALASAAPAPPASPPELSLIYTSDLRGASAPDAKGLGGLPRRATFVDRARLEAGAMLQLDAGDLLPGLADATSDASDARQRATRIVLGGYKRMGVDAVTLGERELELGLEPLQAAVKAFNLSVVAANLLGKGNEHPFPANQLITVKGIPVGVFGILDLPAESAADLQRWGFHTSDAVEAAKESIQSLKAGGARLVVGLFHVAGGVARTKEILAQAGDVDLVVLGHGGEGLAPGAELKIGKTRVLYAGALGAKVGRLDVRSLQPGKEPSFYDQTSDMTKAVRDHIGVGLIEQAELARVRDDQEKLALAARKKKGEKEKELWETWTYGSNGACELCHQAASAQWKTTEHAQAFVALKKGKHDTDQACIGCHSTGYLQPGGTIYVATVERQFTAVGCEMCHGPSALHIRTPNKKKGTGTMRKVGPDVCLGCHTPDQSVDPLDFNVAMKAILGPGHGEPVPAGQPPAPGQTPSP